MFLDQVQVDNAIQDIVSQMYKDQWRPDYIVGITRGGLYPALIMSHQYDLQVHLQQSHQRLPSVLHQF